MARLAIRRHLCTVLHTFLHVLCLVSLILGKIDTAFVDIAEDEANTTLIGKFARIGAIQQVEGELRELDGCENDNTDNDGTLVQEESTSWIGVIQIPGTEYDRHGSKCDSNMDKVRDAIMLGASALFIITVNHKVIRKLELVQIFTRPIVSFNGTNTSKLLKALQRSKSPLKARISYNYSLFSEVQMLSTLTLWATCGRPSGWEGVVCLGNPEKYRPVETTIHVLVYSVLVVLLIAFKEWVERHQSTSREDLLRKLAAEAISKMKIKKLQNARKKQKNLEHERKNDSDVCAVCLDGFYYNNQRVRILPCAHEFHCKCVDSWLIDKRTCPLCKQNIMAELS